MKFAAIASLLLAGSASAATLRPNRMVPPPLADPTFGAIREEANITKPISSSQGHATFPQLIDHANASLGTFTQRYWWSSEFWAGPGSPVILFTPGESAADGYTGYLTTQTLVGRMAQAVGGAVVLLEHRYWGGSSPAAQLTTRDLQHLTLANAVADLTYFARHVRLPFDGGGSSTAPRAPWVLTGGSYSGALAAWTAATAPGTFWAYHATSAVVEAVGDFWRYFEPVVQGLPANCSADVARVVEYVDGVLATGSQSEKQALKEKFGLGGVEHDDDFAAALENGPWEWQGHDFDTGYAAVFEFCDYVENAVPSVFGNATSRSPGAAGVGLEKALDGYARWTSTVMVPGACESMGGYFSGEYNLECYDTYNASSPLFTDVSVGNAIDRQWNWLLCNEPFMFWQDGAPEGTPTLVSRLVNTTYWDRQCSLFFPPDPEDGSTYGLARGKTAEDVNAYTGGWDAAAYAANGTRIVWTNGQFDPWREATVSAESRPGGPLASTPQMPVNVIPGGIHCSDYIYANAQANAGVMAVVQSEIAVIKGWVDEFYKQK